MALTIKRTRRQSVTIGPDIRVTVVETKNSEVQLRIEAPLDLRICREDIDFPPAKVDDLV